MTTTPGRLHAMHDAVDRVRELPTQGTHRTPDTYGLLLLLHLLGGLSTYVPADELHEALARAESYVLGLSPASAGAGEAGDPTDLAADETPAAPAGDACGCPDDRCIGYHHAEDEPCGCVVALGIKTQAEADAAVNA